MNWFAAMVLIIILIVAFLMLFEKVFERTNYYKKNYTETDKLKGKEKADYINTGSTFACYGIDYKAAGVKGLNLALCPQPIAYDFKMLKHYENRYNPGAIVFIVISDLAFAKKEYEEGYVTDKYYKVLGKHEIERYNLFKAIRSKYFPVLYNWKNFFRFYRDIKPDTEYECKVNENDREAVAADASKRCKAWMQEFNLKNLRDASQGKNYSEEFSFTVAIVKSMVTWCQEKGFKPVLVNLPVTSEMSQYFSKEFLNTFYFDHINSIVEDTGARFIDLQKREKLSDYLLYLDSCRLNKIGREIITRILLAKCEK